MEILACPRGRKRKMRNNSLHQKAIVCTFSASTLPALHSNSSRSILTMSAPESRGYRSSINVGPSGSFENGHFIPHRDVATPEETTSSTPTPTPTPKERSATPEWYDSPTSLDHPNPSGVRAGASYPALKTPGSKSYRGRDSVDEGDETPRKRRRLSPRYFKERVRRLWPFPGPAPSPRKLPLTCCATQSATALGQYPLEVEVDHDMPFTVFWALTGYMYTPVYKPVRPARPRTVSSPPAMAEGSSDRVRWWAPSACQARSSILRRADVSSPASEQDDMSEPVSPVTQVPVSPRIEGESKDDDMFQQMDTLVI